MKMKKLVKLFVVIFIITSNFTYLTSAKINKNEKSSDVTLEKKVSKSNSLISSDFLDLLQPGDIIIYIPGREVQHGHCRLFTGFDPIKNKYTIIESFYHVIIYSLRRPAMNFMLFSLAWLYGYSAINIIRVNATAEQKQNAIDFAKLQIGKRFDFYRTRDDKNFNPEDSSDPNANFWYCSELPWAAYYNCNNPFPETPPVDGYVYGDGIDIDQNGWAVDKKGYKGSEYTFVHPMDIVNDDDVQRINVWSR
jgi:uncharacterized protein YycO